MKHAYWKWTCRPRKWPLWSNRWVWPHFSHLPFSNFHVLHWMWIFQIGGNIVALTIDPYQSLLFWANNAPKFRGIYKSNLDGSNTQLIVDKGNKPYIISCLQGPFSSYNIPDILEINGLTVDWSSQHLYWTDAQLRRIEVADYNGQMRKVLFQKGLISPRSILANPEEG